MLKYKTHKQIDWQNFDRIKLTNKGIIPMKGKKDIGIILTDREYQKLCQLHCLDIL